MFNRFRRELVTVTVVKIDAMLGELCSHELFDLLHLVVQLLPALLPQALFNFLDKRHHLLILDHLLFHLLLRSSCLPSIIEPLIRGWKPVHLVGLESIVRCVSVAKKAGNGYFLFYFCFWCLCCGQPPPSSGGG